MARERDWEKEYRQLYERAYRGAATWGSKIPQADDGLSDEELVRLVDELRSSTDKRKQFRTLDILGYGAAKYHKEYQAYLAPFLDGPDAGLALKSLWILCEYWGLQGSYAKHLKDFLRGVPWAAEPWRLTFRGDALRHVTEYLRKHSEPELLREIILMCEYGDEGEAERSEAHNALAQILGRPDVSHSILIEMAKDRLADEERGA